jgi:hypothetical protein
MLTTITSSSCHVAVRALAARSQRSNNSNKIYRYFGYGSNVLPSTMKALRQIQLQDGSTTAAILPDYELKFYGDSASKFQVVESSTAFVQPCKQSATEEGRSVVHGVLYELSEQDFAKVGQTEGVPFFYRWERCRVYPYTGDGKQAGYDAMTTNETLPVDAFTLVAPPNLIQREPNAPPSSSYLGLIQEGARLWKFDRTYQDKLANVAVASNLIISGGVSELTLRLAEKATGTSRNYMIG